MSKNKKLKYIPFNKIFIDKNFVSQIYRDYSIRGMHFNESADELDYLIKQIYLAIGRCRNLEEGYYPISEGSEISMSDYKESTLKNLDTKRKIFLNNLANLYFSEN